VGEDISGCMRDEKLGEEIVRATGMKERTGERGEERGEWEEGEGGEIVCDLENAGNDVTREIAAVAF
jgi:hypothetical protein